VGLAPLRHGIGGPAMAATGHGSGAWKAGWLEGVGGGERGSASPASGRQRGHYPRMAGDSVAAGSLAGLGRGGLEGGAMGSEWHWRLVREELVLTLSIFCDEGVWGIHNQWHGG